MMGKAGEKELRSKLISLKSSELIRPKIGLEIRTEKASNLQHSPNIHNIHETRRCE